MKRGRRYVLVVSMILTVARVLSEGTTLSHNLTALAHSVASKSSLASVRYLASLDGILIWVPAQGTYSDWSRSLPETAQELSPGGQRWEEVTTRSPTYSVEAVNSEWSLLGYDVLANADADMTIRLYWHSPAVYVQPPALRTPGEAHTLAAGQRVYQDLMLNRTASVKRSRERPEAPSCPSIPSALDKTARFIDDRTAIYAVPVAFEKEFCYFGIVLPDTAEIGTMVESRIVEEEDGGAWVLIRKEASPLHNRLPSWRFSTVQSTLGWTSANTETAVGVRETGLVVTSSGTDASVVGPTVSLDPRQAQRVVVVSRANSGSTIELFWTTLGNPRFSQQMSQALQLQSDGRWHSYEFDLSAEEKWREVITRLRLDPSDREGSSEIASITVQ